MIWEKTIFDPNLDIKYLEDREIERVYISHGHADHFQQANFLHEKGAKVLAPKKDVEYFPFAIYD